MKRASERALRPRKLKRAYIPNGKAQRQQKQKRRIGKSKGRMTGRCLYID